MLLIKNGRVLDPASKTDAALDVLLDGERISKVGSNLSAPDAEIFDAKGLIVAPGFIDLHCHLARAGAGTFGNDRDGNARGGARRIHGRVLHAQHAAGERQGVGDDAGSWSAPRRRPACACGRLARRRWEARARRWRKLRAMKDAGIVGVSDDGKPIATARLMRQVMDYCNALGLAGDRSLRGYVAGRRRRDAGRPAVGAAGTERHSGGIGIHLRGARRGSGGADRSAAAHRAHVHAGFARTCASGEAARAARDMRSDAAPLHADR